jgi:hypothetical protein
LGLYCEVLGLAIVPNRGTFLESLNISVKPIAKKYSDRKLKRIKKLKLKLHETICKAKGIRIRFFFGNLRIEIGD